MPANSSSELKSISHPAVSRVTSSPGSRSSEVRKPISAKATRIAKNDDTPTPVTRAHAHGAAATATHTTAATTPIHEPPATSIRPKSPWLTAVAPAVAAVSTPPTAASEAGAAEDRDRVDAARGGPAGSRAPTRPRGAGRPGRPGGRRRGDPRSPGAGGGGGEPTIGSAVHAAVLADVLRPRAPSQYRSRLGARRIRKPRARHHRSPPSAMRTACPPRTTIGTRGHDPPVRAAASRPARRRR